MASIGGQSWRGIFFRAGEPESYRSGILEKDEDSSLKLTIFGLENIDKWSLKFESYNYIHGVVQGGVHITLLNCVDSKLMSFTDRVLTVSFAVIGIAFDDFDSPFGEFTLTSQSIMAWYARGHSIDHSSGRNSVVFKYKNSGKKRSRIDDVRSCFVWCGHDYAYGLSDDGSLSFRSIPYVGIRYRLSQSWSSIWGDVSKIEELFRIVGRRSDGVPFITLRSRKKILNKDTGKREYEIYQVLISWVKGRKSGGWRGPLFTYADSIENLGNIVNLWFKISHDCRDPVALFQSATSGNVTLIAGFLFLIQSLEGFHRSRVDGSLMDEEKFGEIKLAIINIIDSFGAGESFSTLKTRVSNWNEPALRRRIMDIINIIDPNKILISNKKYRKHIPNNISDLRNTISHGRSVSDDRDVWYDKIAASFDLLQVFIELFICREVGFSQAAIYEILAQDRGVEWLKRRAEQL